MNFRRSLAAILLGNLIYFLLMPYLPRAAQHQLYKLDLGLMLDFCLCVALWALLKLFSRRAPNRN